MKITDALIHLIGARDPNCPNEPDVLAYSENRLSTRNRARIERHVVNCDDCLEVLSFLGRETHEVPVALTEDAISSQANKVLGYIQDDERNRRKPVPKVRRATGFQISYPRFATAGVFMSAIAIAIVYLLIPSAADEGMTALKLADLRYTKARISELDYSPYVGPTRGPESKSVESNNDDTLHFDRAESKVKAETDVDARLVLARVYLARGGPKNAKLALEILDQLMERGVDTAEAFNDMGVAQLQLRAYPEAIDYFNKALAKSPSFDAALFNKALAEEGDHRYDDAKRDWHAFIAKSSDENWKNEAREHLSGLNSATDR